METNELKQKIEGFLNECSECMKSVAFVESEVESLRKSFIRKIEEVND